MFRIGAQVQTFTLVSRNIDTRIKLEKKNRCIIINQNNTINILNKMSIYKNIIEVVIVKHHTFQNIKIMNI